jgi:hypothetical protein
MMNVHIHTYVADNTTYHMVYVRLMLLSISYYEHSMSVSFTNDVILQTTWYITPFVNDSDMLCYSMISKTTLV